jgi:myosin heavy subunit
MFQVLLRGGVLTRLEEERDSRLGEKVVRLQACARGYLARRNLQKIKVGHVRITAVLPCTLKIYTVP